MDGEEGRVRAGIHRADSLQLTRAPVHADEIDTLRPGAFGIGPNVEKIIIRRTLRATREPDETDRRRGQEVAARQVARMGHLGASSRTAFPGATTCNLLRGRRFEELRLQNRSTTTDSGCGRGLLADLVLPRRLRPEQVPYEVVPPPPHHVESIPAVAVTGVGQNQ